MKSQKAKSKIDYLNILSSDINPTTNKTDLIWCYNCKEHNKKN